jgi:predicted nucleic acid-binding protein
MVTIDTNVAFYAMAKGQKGPVAKAMLSESNFLSAQVLNEFASSVRRKMRRSWQDIGEDVEILRCAVPYVAPIEANSNRDALRLAERYQLNFYDAVMIAVALANGATTLYSEDMQNGMVIDGVLTIVDPFAQGVL